MSFLSVKTNRKLAPFRVGYFRPSGRPYSPYYRATFAFSGIFYPPRHPPSLRLGYRGITIPWYHGAHGAYPVDDRGGASQRGWSLSPGGATDVAARTHTVQPAHSPFWLQRVSLLALLSIYEVYQLFALVQPSGSSLALSRLRLAAFGTLSLRLRTSALAFARSGRDTWTSQGLCHVVIALLCGPYLNSDVYASLSYWSQLSSSKGLSKGSRYAQITRETT
ncbi:MAG: hypothetical protein MAG451_01176 [Anaerolineales bacterium]|nr:hypothetical protein [Anaerolineales bacterium]